jgi:hypothetical protein
MGYETEYQSYKGIVKVTIDGKLNFEIVRKYSIDSTKLAHRNKCKKFLIEHSGEDQKSETYHIHADSSELEQFGYKKTDMVAIVTSLPEKDQLSLVTAGYNAGWSNVKFFQNAGEAIRWLMEEK